MAAPLEEENLPSVEKIVERIRQTLAG